MDDIPFDTRREGEPKSAQHDEEQVSCRRTGCGVGTNFSDDGQDEEMETHVIFADNFHLVSSSRKELREMMMEGQGHEVREVKSIKAMSALITTEADR